MISGLQTVFAGGSTPATAITPPNGFCFPLQIYNQAGSTITLATNTGVTLYGSTLTSSSSYYSLQIWIWIVSPSAYIVLNSRDY